MYGIFVACLTLCWAFRRDGFLPFSQMSPCPFYGRNSFLLYSSTAWEVGKVGPPGRTAEASIPRLCEAQAHILPSLLFPA